MKTGKLMTVLLLWTWCLPQTLLGGLVFLFVVFGDPRSYHFSYIGGTRLVRTTLLGGGLSLGAFLFSYDYARAGGPTMGVQVRMDRHEWGHLRQSLMLGPLYLLVVGLPSLFWALVYRKRGSRMTRSYYTRYPEAWADRLGGVSR